MVDSVRRRGFTLLEMSVVLVIIGLITSMGITSGIGALESAKRTQTVNKIEYIEEALQAFRNKNHRLPCPADASLQPTDTNYGVSAANPGSCTGSTPAANFGTAGSAVEGAVPVQTLSLPSEYLYDGWGRKFAYAVDTNMTYQGAFDATPITDQCGITVNDASGNPRSSGAVYALISFGPAGHGGFLAGGTRMNAGLTATDVLTNCHCNSSGSATAYNATYVEKDPMGVPGSLTAFDNIVDFKERWQLTNYDDQVNFANIKGYQGPRVLAGFASGTNTAYDYGLQCGRLKKLGDLNPVANSGAVGVVFTPANDYMLVFSSAGCVLYQLAHNGLQIGTGSTTALPSCPSYNANMRMAISNNGYLALTYPSSPYVLLWQQSGGSFTYIGGPNGTPLGSQPDSISMTNDYMLVSNKSATTGYMILYGHAGINYTPLATQPSGIPTGVYSSTVGSTESYIAASVNGAVSGTPAPPLIYVWAITSLDGFSAPSTLTLTNENNPAAVTFSPDGKYMVVGGKDGNDNMIVYGISATGTFSQLAAPSSWTSTADTAGIGFAFSSDSSYLVMATSSTTHPLVLFRQYSAQSYKYAGDPDQAPSSVAATSVSFNH